MGVKMTSVRQVAMVGLTVMGMGGLAGCGALRAGAVPSEGGEGWANEPSPLVWESAYTQTPPKVDGTLDPVWRTARPITVTVREAMGGDHPMRVVLRSLHTDDTFYMVAEWADDTESDMRDPYVWNRDTEGYDRPTKPDDQFAVEFPMSGDFAISMLTVMREYTADVWHWKAGRGNGVGRADDKYHVISQQPVPQAKARLAHGGQSVYIARVGDAGGPAFKLKAEPAAHIGDVVDSFELQEATGSRADVSAKGTHDGKGWILEMSRAFDTGHPEDDAVIDPSRDNLCAIAVLNDELNEEHSVSTVITLRFTRPEGDDGR